MSNGDAKYHLDWSNLSTLTSIQVVSDSASVASTSATLESVTGDSGLYTFTGQYRPEYILGTSDPTSDSSVSKLTYNVAATSSKFSINGLTGGLSVDTLGANIFNGTSTVGTISGGVVTLGKSAVNMGLFTNNSLTAITLTDTDNIEPAYSLSLAYELLQEGNTVAASFTDNGGGSYTFQDTYHNDAFSKVGENVYKFMPNDKDSVGSFSVTNLSSGVSSILSLSMSGKTLVLGASALQGSLSSGASIILTQNRAPIGGGSYSLSLASDTETLQVAPFAAGFSGVTYNIAGRATKSPTRRAYRLGK